MSTRRRRRGELPRPHAARLAGDKAHGSGGAARAARPGSSSPPTRSWPAAGGSCPRPIDRTRGPRAAWQLLSGRRHRVLWRGLRRWPPTGGGPTRVVTTMVQFKRLTDGEIAAYLDSGEWQGKAGGYAIQGLAAAFVPAINGSYTNVVGPAAGRDAGAAAGPGLEAAVTHAGRARGDRLRHPRRRAGRRPADRDPRQRPRRSARSPRRCSRPGSPPSTPSSTRLSSIAACRSRRCWSPRTRAPPPAAPSGCPIRQLVHEGQRLIVQGVREPVGRQGCAGHQRREAVRLCAGPQPGGPDAGAGAATGPAPGARRCASAAGRCSPMGGSRCAAMRPSCRTTRCCAEAERLLAERWRTAGGRGAGRQAGPAAGAREPARAPAARPGRPRPERDRGRRPRACSSSSSGCWPRRRRCRHGR